MLPNCSVSTNWSGSSSVITSIFLCISVSLSLFVISIHRNLWIPTGGVCLSVLLISWTLLQLSQQWGTAVPHSTVVRNSLPLELGVASRPFHVTLLNTNPHTHEFNFYLRKHSVPIYPPHSHVTERGGSKVCANADRIFGRRASALMCFIPKHPRQKIKSVQGSMYFNMCLCVHLCAFIISIINAMYD